MVLRKRDREPVLARFSTADVQQECVVKLCLGLMSCMHRTGTNQRESRRVDRWSQKEMSVDVI